MANREARSLGERSLDFRKGEDLVAAVSLAQSLYFVVTGLWGIVSINTFQKVTGPKVDTWLVRTVSVLIVVIGAVLGMAGTGATPRRRSPYWA